MECTCVRQTDIPHTSKLFTDLIYHFDRVADLYPAPPNNLAVIADAARFDFPASRRAQLVSAITPLNQGNPSLPVLARDGTVAIVTGQQVGLFSGPSYTIYKALTAIRIASELSAAGTPAVPVFWLATEDHDFAEVDHAWVFGPDQQPSRLRMTPQGDTSGRPVGGIAMGDVPLDGLRQILNGLPFAEDAVALVARAYAAGETMGSAFAHMLRELFAPYGLLLVDPMDPALRRVAAPLVGETIGRMGELTAALVTRSRELVERGYHAQVLVENDTSLLFLLGNGQRIALRHAGGVFTAHRHKISAAALSARAEELSPNALLRPVVQDYMIPTAAYVGGPAEIAYLAQSQVLYQKLLGRQPVAFPRAGFTLLDSRTAKRISRYGLSASDLMGPHRILRETIAARLVPEELRRKVEASRTSVTGALTALGAGLKEFDPGLANALETSRRKIEYQFGKIERKTASHIFMRDEQALRDAAMLSGLIFPDGHLQERLYSIVPFLAKFGPGLIQDIYENVRVECPDHQLMTI